jgi:DNA-binding PucR family transcriptional regulator
LHGSPCSVAAGHISAIERFAPTWLGALLGYDAVHGTRLVVTLGEYLDCGRGYDATVAALSVHRSTLKYQLRLIRKMSGHFSRHPGHTVQTSRGDPRGTV